MLSTDHVSITGGIVSPNASSTPDEPGTRIIALISAVRSMHIFWVNIVPCHSRFVHKGFSAQFASPAMTLNAAGKGDDIDEAMLYLNWTFWFMWSLLCHHEKQRIYRI